MKQDILRNDPLKDLVSQGNLKIGKDTLIFNITPAKYCSSEKLGLCKHANICYAKKAERLYPSVLPFRIRQFLYWENCTADQFASEIIEIIKRKKTKIKFLRFNESGDFRSQYDIVKLSQIADLLSDTVKVYTYTARKDLDFTRLSDNLTINGSGFMIHNNFSITKDKSLVNCPANCRTCNKCKFSTGKVIYGLEH